jgi:hypothetical protein
MSINSAHAQGGVLIFAGERILIYYDGIEMKFEGPSDVVPLKGKKKGRCYLTTHRVIFNSKDGKDSLQSFSFPFLLMREVELEQPIFGANYIKGRIKAEPQANWNGEAKFDMYFNKGGAIEFGQAMLKAASLAQRNRPANPPAYYPPPPNAGYYAAPPPAYSPPQNSHYSWVPYDTFPTAPPAQSVYMTEAPPPYPGVDPSMAYPPPNAAYPPPNAAYPPPNAAYPPQQYGGAYSQPSAPVNDYDAKAQEAAASAYYDPSNTHNFYAPAANSMAPPAYGFNTGPPPSYNEAQKKQN